MNWHEASRIAETMMGRLSPHCERIDIAGSVRRSKPDCGDIELVAVPKTIPIRDLFGNVTGERSLLYDRKLHERFGVVNKCGERFVQIELLEGINLDLFVVMPPADWAVIMAIRTGPAEFSHWLVTPRSKGGALHNGWRCEDGRIWDGQTEIRWGVDEIAFLDWMGIGWLNPSERKPMWNYFRRDYRA